MAPRVKICGLTLKEDIYLLSSLGVHALGFVVDYPVPVPWNLSIEQARQLLSCVPPLVSTVVVTAGTTSKILQIAQLLAPHFIQLHGNESLAETEDVSAQLAKLGIRVIKALRLRGKTAHFEIEDPLRAARALQETDIAALLLDASGTGGAGGSGISVDWNLAREIRDCLSIPLILAGGLTPDNITRAIHTVQPSAVDILTGVEHRPGKKDPAKVKALLEAISAARCPPPG